MNKLYITLLFTLLTFAGYSQTQPVAARKQVNQSKTPVQVSKDADAKAVERANQMTNSMARQLGLSGAQIAKVREINLSSVKQVEEAREKYRNDLKSFQHQMELISNSRLSRIKDVLSPQQFDLYQRKREEKMGIPQPHSGQPSGSGIQVPGGGYSN